MFMMISAKKLISQSIKIIALAPTRVNLSSESKARVAPRPTVIGS